MKRTFLAFSILLTGTLFAQQIPQSFRGKTHMMSENEMNQLGTIGKDFTPTSAPEGKIRNIAEFERMEGVIITSLPDYYGTGAYFGIPIDLIKEMAEDIMVYTVVETQGIETYVKNQFIGAEVNLNNVTFVQAEADSYWSRDYSPWFIQQDSNMAIVDFPYNRPRPNDNKMPSVFGTKLGLNVYKMNLVSTGGNYMTDGMGISASCDLVKDENPSLSEENINSLVKDYLGVHKYHLVADPLDDYIEHIDCWGKFLDVDKILITRVPESDYRYADFEATAAYWGAQTTSYGNKYKVFRVYSPNGQPYTNSLILNNKVLVPIVSGTGSNWNDSALNVYRKAMPGYEVIGFLGNNSTPWESTDALHCRTHEIPNRGMLHIQHVAIKDSVNIDSLPNWIETEVVSLAKEQLTTVDMNMSINSEPFKQVSMTLVVENGKKYFRTSMPELLIGDTLNYFITAADKSGKIENHPFMGKTDPHSFRVYKASGNNDNIAKKEFKLFPNPATNQLGVLFSESLSENTTISITDLSGRIVMTTNYQNGQLQMIDISQLLPGIYLLRLETEQNLIPQKFIKR